MKKLLIEIPDDLYEAVKNEYSMDNKQMFYSTNTLYRAVKDGIVISEGVYEQINSNIPVGYNGGKQ